MTRNVGLQACYGVNASIYDIRRVVLSDLIAEIHRRSDLRDAADAGGRSFNGAR